MIPAGGDNELTPEALSSLELQAEITRKQVAAVYAVRLRDSKILYANPSFESLFGYDPGELVGKHASIVHAPQQNDPKETAREILETIEQCGHWKGEILNRRKDGSTFLCWAQTSLFENSEHGAVAVTMHVDITERRIRENALQQALRHFRGLIENSWDGIALFGRDGEIQFASPSTKRILGYEPDEMVSRNAFDLIHPDDHETVRASLLKSLTEPAIGVPVAAHVQHKNGEWRYLEGIFTNLLHVPHIGAIVNNYRDVTERRRQEEQVRIHRERLLRFMDSATESFHLVDRNFRVLEINKSALLALSEALGVHDKQQVMGCNLLDLYPFLAGEGGAEQFEEVLRTGEPITFEKSVDHPTRATVHMTVRVFKVGKDLGIIATDTSDQKRAEENRLQLERQIQQTQKLESLGILAGGIAHDFNNVLVSILGYTDLALREIPPSALEREYLEEVMKGARRAAELANQMLAYSGKGLFDIRSGDLNTIVQEMLQLLRVTVLHKAELKCEFADNLPPINADKTQIQQVIMNLVSNASEAIENDAGRITLRTGLTSLPDGGAGDQDLAAGSYVVLEVTDNGCGMDEETQEKLFDPFFTTKFTGRGLGMAVVQGIVRGHRGSIEIQTARGKGTRVEVLLPAIREAAGTARQPPDKGTEKEWTGSGTILLIDDEEAVRGACSRMLEKIGFKVLLADNGRRGLDLFRAHSQEIACVILDLTMPLMDGHECYQRLRRENAEVQVVLSSGYTEAEMRQRFPSRGVASFIRKPFRLQTLQETLQQVLEP